MSRLAANYRAVAAFAGRPVIAVVKADAYGHGAVRVARTLEAAGAAMLAVAYAEEAALLRDAGVCTPILVLAGLCPGRERQFHELSLTAVVANAISLEGALAAARLGPLSVHLEVDTGMARLGVEPSACPAVAARLAGVGARVDGLMTHLAAADEDPAATRRQLDAFDAVVADLARHGFRPSFVHASNSAGLAALRPTHTAVRPGLLLYGLRPRPIAPRLEVEPALSVVARVLQIRDVPAGTPVSYGGRWRAPRPSRIATLAFGYADGMPRTETASARGFAVVGGARAPLAGAVCMDFTQVDVTDTSASEGDEATVFGCAPSAWDLAEWAGTNPWQVLSAIGARVPRVWYGAP